MCGLAGLFSLSEGRDLDSRLSAALDLLSRRGPDGESREFFSLSSGNLCLGHRRLAIIDLSEVGLQPMKSSCGRYWIVFNGEIYNYRELRKELIAGGASFQTETDTEVLLEAYIRWGEAAVPKLIGMFAFVVFDRERQQLDCYRDAFGIKPFFYSRGSSYFAFASEISALRALRPERTGPNLQRAFDYLSMGRYDDNSATFFDGISRLEPGCRLRIKLDDAVSFEIDRWWSPAITERQRLSFADAADLVRSEFLNNVRLHLRSDVPFGAALSGGIDSSALVGAMRHLEPDLEIHTFSYVAAEGATSEEAWVDMVNDHVRATPHKVRISSDDLFADLDDMIRAQGEPFGSTSIYASYRVYKMVREAGVVVCLDGQGADEMFAGYHGYPHLRLRSLFERGEFSEMLHFLNSWSAWPGRSRSDAMQRLAAELLPPTFHSVGRRVTGRGVLKPWLKGKFLDDAGVSTKSYVPGHRKKNARGRRVVEYERFLLGYGGFERLLRHGDRNSMRWSVESRVPFLTPGLAELALSLPEDHLISHSGETKCVLRAALRGLVPDAILDRRDKVGFETPELQWLRSDKLDLDEILDPAARLGFFELDRLANSIRQVLSAEKPFSSETWRIINYCKWAGLVLEDC